MARLVHGGPQGRGVAVPLLARLGPGELARDPGARGRRGSCCAARADDRCCRRRRSSSRPGRGRGRRAWTVSSPTTSPTCRTARRPDDVADIMYTSGTTGEPKGVDGAPRRAVLDRPRPVGLARPRLPLLVALRHHQRVAARLRAAARGHERMVPAAVRPGPLARRRGSGAAGGGLPGAGHGGADRGPTPVRDGRPVQPGRRHHRQRAHRHGHAAALRGRPALGRGALRLRHDRVRRGDRHARWATVGDTWGRSASRCPGSRSASWTPTARRPAGRRRARWPSAGRGCGAPITRIRPPRPVPG